MGSMGSMGDTSIGGVGMWHDIGQHAGVLAKSTAEPSEQKYTIRFSAAKKPRPHSMRKNIASPT